MAVSSVSSVVLHATYSYVLVIVLLLGGALASGVAVPPGLRRSRAQRVRDGQAHARAAAAVAPAATGAAPVQVTGLPPPAFVRTYTEEEVLKKGLELAGYSRRQMNNCYATNLRRFMSFYGSWPIAIAKLFEDLQTTPLAEARIDEQRIDMDLFLLSMYFLKSYGTEEKESALMKMTEKTCRKHHWYYVEKIQALKAQVVVWPEEWGTPASPEFLYTVDGTHCEIYELKNDRYELVNGQDEEELPGQDEEELPGQGLPNKPESKNRKLYSHKHNRAALTYELALHLWEPRLVWMNGPYPAGQNDITVFRKALKNKTPLGKRAIGDNGYRGEPAVMSTPNVNDSATLRKFKGRARARQESFNTRIKFFGILANRFRSKGEGAVKKHKMVFEAVCIIVQYQMDTGCPVFDI